ncbi:hypothetical protein OESDEN_04560 [Oesophagostomum dentatum]|uniref:Uncharacterized protein n=1 Tax=Oesophagostomum dentatum TaxID=61180 RepID=A0A0B1TD60_OESDE|nr:hypothetical protein OESDEN_04560 [Oesophagostomum dentatum]
MLGYQQQIYDCELEAKAENKLKHPEVQLPQEYATVEFRFQNRRREGHYSHALELEMGIDMFKDEDKLRVVRNYANKVQMINPRATRFGCWESQQASEPRLLCIYDKKFVKCHVYMF